MGLNRIAAASLPVWFWGVLAVTAPQAFALSPGLSVSQYLHSSWTEVNGKPFPATFELAQGADGYLWIGSDTGLLRFDGVRFSAGVAAGETLASTRIHGLAASSRGGVWVVTNAGVTRVQPGRSKLYRLSMADRRIGGIFEDS